MAKASITIAKDRYTYHEATGKWMAGNRPASDMVAKMLNMIDAQSQPVAEKPPIVDASDTPPDVPATPPDAVPVTPEPEPAPISKAKGKKQREPFDVDSLFKTPPESENKIEETGLIYAINNLVSSIKTLVKPDRPIPLRDKLSKLNELNENEVQRLNKLGVAPSSEKDFSYRKDGTPLTKEELLKILNRDAEIHNKKIDEKEAANEGKVKWSDAGKDFKSEFKNQLSGRANYLNYIPKIGDWLKPEAPKKKEEKEKIIKDKKPRNKSGKVVVELDSSKLLGSIDTNVGAILSHLTSNEQPKKDADDNKKNTDTELKNIEKKENHAEKQDQAKIDKTEAKAEKSADTPKDGEPVPSEKAKAPKRKKKEGSNLKDMVKEPVAAEAGEAAGGIAEAGGAAGAVAEGGGLLATLGEGAAAIGGVLAAPEVLAGVGAAAAVGGLGYAAYKAFEPNDPSPKKPQAETVRPTPQPTMPVAAPVKPAISQDSQNLREMVKQKDEEDEKKSNAKFGSAGHININNNISRNSSGSSGGGGVITATAGSRNSLDLNIWSN
jgi:hypothetical protein